MSLRTRNKKRKRFFVGFLLLCCIGFFVYIGLLQTVAQYVAVPFMYTGQTVKNTFFTVRSSFIPESNLLEENRILQERINTLERELALGETRDFFTEEEFTPAIVLARPHQNVYGTLLIRPSSQEEISVGDAVIAKEGALLGIVDEVSSFFVRVTLSSHAGFSQNMVVERSGIPISVVGTGGGNMKAELPQGADIEEADIIIDSLSGRVVAEVGQVEVDQTSAFVTAYMRMPINIFEIKEVFIVPTLE